MGVIKPIIQDLNSSESDSVTVVEIVDDLTGDNVTEEGT